MKRFFFLAGKRTAMGDLVERHVNYPQLYVSSCVCSLLFNSDERALFAPCSDPPNLFTTSRLSTLYLTRGVICYIRSEEFYHRIHHQEFLRKVCYQGILKCAAHFRGNSPAKRRYIFVMTKRICKFSLPWDFD